MDAVGTCQNPVNNAATQAAQLAAHIAGDPHITTVTGQSYKFDYLSRECILATCLVILYWEGQYIGQFKSCSNGHIVLSISNSLTREEIVGELVLYIDGAVCGMGFTLMRYSLAPMEVALSRLEREV